MKFRSTFQVIHFLFLTAIVSCFTCNTFSQFPEKLNLETVRSDWKKIENGLDSFSGMAQSEPTAASKGESMTFLMRGALMKRLDQNSPKEENVWLWAKSGRYLLRKPKNGNWSIAQSDKPNTKITQSPLCQKKSSTSILGASLLYMTSSSDFRVLRLERTSKDEAVLELDSLRRLSTLKYNPDILDQPMFDKATVYLDPHNRYRILNCRLERSYATGDIRVGVNRIVYTYSDTEAIDIPTSTSMTYEKLDGTILNRLGGNNSNVSHDAPPESEFTLEFYGLQTPLLPSTVNWWFVSLFALLSVVFLGLGVRYFRR